MIRPVPGSQAEPEPSFYELVRESRDAPGRIQGMGILPRFGGNACACGAGGISYRFGRFRGSL